ncbi:O-antigen ligase family protein [Brevundimonas sp.]|jgi:exopolysaccharide production protein ExoQ|uniref:O-antigen ligase family protein n=1 Tax=Brevundimonas sp. TaxID=1871086 RepID=UPI0037C00869
MTAASELTLSPQIRPLPTQRPAQEPPSRWPLIFCSLAFLFFQGALTHLFGASDGSSGGALKALFLPVALLIQLSAIVLLALPKRQRIVLELLPRNPWMLLAIAFIVLSALWSIDPNLTIRRSIALLGTTAVGLLVYIEVGRERLLRFFAINLAIFTVLSVLFSIAVPSLGTHVHDKFAGQWRGLLGFKNQAAWSASLFIIIWLGSRKTNWMKKLNWPLLAVGFLMLLQTKSATGLAATTFGVATFISLYLFRRFVIFRPIALTALAIILVLVFTDAGALFSTILELLGRDASLTGRTSIWTALLPFIQDRLWLGSGYQAFWDHAAEFFGTSSWMASIGHAHNAYIEILLDVGIVGLIIQLAFLLHAHLKLFLSSMRGNPDSATMFVIFLTFTVIGFAGALFFRPNTGIWVMIVAFSFYAFDRRPRLARQRSAAG